MMAQSQADRQIDVLLEIARQLGRIAEAMPQAKDQAPLQTACAACRKSFYGGWQAVAAITPSGASLHQVCAVAWLKAHPDDAPVFLY